jgi:uncharacterized MAPEG superfamily protein
MNRIESIIDGSFLLLGTIFLDHPSLLPPNNEISMYHFQNMNCRIFRSSFVLLPPKENYYHVFEHFGNFSVVATSISVCAVKLTLVHLLTVRERLMSDVFCRKKGTKRCGPPSGQSLRPTWVVSGNSRGGAAAFIARCERAGKNIAENETMFFLLALPFGMYLSSNAAAPNTTTETAMTLVKVYTAARVSPTLFYLTKIGFNVGLRSLSFMVGMLCAVGMVPLTLSATLEKSNQILRSIRLVEFLRLASSSYTGSI